MYEKETTIVPGFHISKEGALIVDPPGDMDFPDFFAKFGFGPENVSDAFNASCALIEQYHPGIVALIMYGETEEGEGKEKMKEFITKAMAHEHGDAMMAAANLIQQSLELAKANFLSGIRLAVALRDGVLSSVNFDELSVYDSTDPDIDKTPAKVEGAH